MVGFQTMVIMDLWGMAFHAVVAIALILSLLFILISTYCALRSKSILKVESQMVRLCDYGTVFFSYLLIDFLTFLALLKNTFGDGTPCRSS